MLQTLSCNLFSKEECKVLIDQFESKISLISSNTNVNSNYDGRVLNADECDSLIKNFLYESSIEVATLISKVYGEITVYPETIHIVKWPEGTELGTHADNWFIDQNKPNYSPNRNYSATFLLNDDFDGGEFYFESEDGSKSTQPVRIGWGSIFGAGKEYPHGVNKVLKGNRYTVAVWYTRDYEHSIYMSSPQTPQFPFINTSENFGGKPGL